MKQLKDALTQIGRGHLLIYSNKGLYRYRPSAAKAEETEDFKTPVGGTIIEWCLPLDGASSVNV